MRDATKIAAFRCILEPELTRSVSVFLCNSKQVESQWSCRDGTSIGNLLIVRQAIYLNIAADPVFDLTFEIGWNIRIPLLRQDLWRVLMQAKGATWKGWKALKLTYTQDHSGMFHVYIHLSHVICGRTFATWLEGVQSCYGVASIFFRFGCNSFWILHPVPDHSDHALLFSTHLSHYLSIVLDL